MPKRETIFYSWQSDTPSKYNRSFIEKALIEALNRLKSDATLEPALRERQVELDKDTQGVAGSPPIAQTILRKIEDCSVFVADMTFVGQSFEDLVTIPSEIRQIPNPNVLLEYGYALHCQGHERLITIMNSAFGDSNPDNLPFDLRHLRWPITYNLNEANNGEKGTEYEKLVRVLVKALALALNSEVRMVSPTPFVPQQHTYDQSIFFATATDLIPEMSFGRSPGEFKVPSQGRMFLRLYPLTEVPSFKSELEALAAAKRGPIWPMGNVRGCDHVRNIFGAMSFEQIHEGELLNATQVFLSRELWGFDAFALNKALIQFYAPPPVGTSHPFIPSTYVEEIFTSTLDSYMKFSKAVLGLPLPLRVEAGLVGIKDYRIAVSNNRIAGRCLTDIIAWKADISSYENPAGEILLPFFELIWAKCGASRGSRG